MQDYRANIAALLRHCLLTLALLAMPVSGQAEAAATKPLGSLIIVGGGDTPLSVQGLFVKLAGGPGKARIAIFPMASTESDEEAQEVIADFHSLNAETEVVSIGPTEAQSPAIADYLEGFSGYWFLGGDQSRLAESLLGSRALEVIERRYMAGATIGGTSAGAAVMTHSMLTGRRQSKTRPGQNSDPMIARGTYELGQGFGLLPGAIVDQHFLKRARYNRLLSAVLDKPHLLGVGIDEETAIVVRPDGLWEVIGASYVKIFDARRAHLTDDDDTLVGASGVRMHLLPAGSLFDPKSGRARLPSH